MVYVAILVPKLKFLKSIFYRYIGQSDLVDHVFPLLREKDNVEKKKTGSFPASDQFSSFTYWRTPVIEIELPTPEVPSKVSKKDEKK